MSQSLKVNAVIQARMTSTRLPGKSMVKLAELPTLGWTIRALKESNSLDNIVIATSTDTSDDVIAKYCELNSVPLVRGALDDVLGRFLDAIDQYPCDAVVRVTADCPLLDPAIVNLVVGAWRSSPWLDYLSTINPRSLPRGLDVELARSSALKESSADAASYHRSHVTSFLYSNPDRFAVAGFSFESDNSDLRVTLDTHEDLNAINAIITALGNKTIPHQELIRFLREHPEVVAMNKDVTQKDLTEG